MSSGPSDSPLDQLVALAREKGYAVDFALYGGEQLDEYVGGARLTGTADAMDSIRAGVRALTDAEPNPGRPR